MFVIIVKKIARVTIIMAFGEEKNEKIQKIQGMQKSGRSVWPINHFLPGGLYIQAINVVGKVAGGIKHDHSHVIIWSLFFSDSNGIISMTRLLGSSTLSEGKPSKFFYFKKLYENASFEFFGKSDFLQMLSIPLLLFLL